MPRELIFTPPLSFIIYDEYREVIGVYLLFAHLCRHSRQSHRFRRVGIIAATAARASCRMRKHFLGYDGGGRRGFRFRRRHNAGILGGDRLPETQQMPKVLACSDIIAKRWRLETSRCRRRAALGVEDTGRHRRVDVCECRHDARSLNNTDTARARHQTVELDTPRRGAEYVVNYVIARRRCARDCRRSRLPRTEEVVVVNARRKICRHCRPSHAA